MTTSSAGADVNAPVVGEQDHARREAEDIRRRGIKRFLLTLPAYIAVLFILALGVAFGVTDPTVSLVTALLMGCAIPVFYGVLRSGVMVRTSDPLMAFTQVLFHLFMVALGYALFDGLRSTVLLWLSVIVVFDMRRLPRRQVQIATAMCVLSLMLAALARACWHASGVDWVYELFTALLLAVVLPVLIAVSSQARGVRRRHLQQKEQMKQALDQLQLLSVRDGLTGLFNRSHMLGALENEARRCERSGQPFWVAIVDLDLFKQINDRFGHAVGDVVLQRFGSLAQGAVPGLADMFARWGGEEFLVLQTSRSESEALACLMGLRQTVHQYDWAQHAPGLSVTFSAGVCEHRQGCTLEQTLEQADQALYQAKAAGRDRIVTASGVTATELPASMSQALVQSRAASDGMTWHAPMPTTETPASAMPEPASSSRWQRVLNGLLGPDTRLRTSQYLCLMSATVYLVCIAGFLLYVVPAGLLTPREGWFFVAHNAIAAIVPSVLLRTGVSARWRDPGIVLPQIMWGGMGGIIGYGMMPSTSPSTLQLICLSMVFGFSSLRPNQARMVGVSYIVMFLAVLGVRAWVQPPSFKPHAEVLEVAMTCLVVWVLTLLSRSFSLRRESVRAEKRALAAATEQVNQLMTTDTLTGLCNRRHMQDLLARECERQQRAAAIKPVHWCVALIDLDHFKRINDTYGHRAGDDVLIGFARCAQLVLRETDMICRWGGEEFLILLADTEPGPSALLALNRLREQVARQTFGNPDEPLRVTFSAGITEHVLGEPITDTLERADRALYDAKAAGRNQCLMSSSLAQAALQSDMSNEAGHADTAARLASAPGIQTPSNASLSF